MYNEEIQEQACNRMKELGLFVGRMLELTDSVMPNVVIGTDEAGDFWYGDIDIAQDAGKLRDVAMKIEQSLNLVSATSNKTMRISAQ